MQLTCRSTAQKKLLKFRQNTAIKMTKFIFVFLIATLGASSFAGTPGMMETPEVRQQRMSKRLDILKDELNQNVLFLKEAETQLLKSPQDKKLNDNKRLLQANIDALNREISVAQGKSDNPVRQKANPAQAGNSNPRQNHNSNGFEAWDVFKNFPKGTPTNEEVQ